MDAQDFRSLQEAYLEVVENQQLNELTPATPENVQKAVNRRDRQDRRNINHGAGSSSPFWQKLRRVDDAAKKYNKRHGTNVKTPLGEQYDLYDIVMDYLLDEGYAETPEAAEAIMVNMSEEWRDDIMEKEDSEYEKASDAALDSRYGYGRASGDKRSFGRAANRASAAAALRAIRRGERSGSGTSREAGSDAVHQGWAKTAKTSSDQTPEKKARRAGLANTPYSKLPDDEKEKDRVSFDAVRATYNRNRNKG
jgi:hypothetical protein